MHNIDDSINEYCDSRNTQYCIGEYVIYGTSGVCIVEDIALSPIQNDNKMYYILRPVNTSVTAKIFTTVGSDRVCMRKLMSKSEAEELIASMPSIKPIEVRNEKDRRSIYRDTMATNNPSDWVSIIKTVRIRRQYFAKIKKRMTDTDSEYDSLAKLSLYGEISKVLGITGDEIEEYIIGK